MPRVMIQEGRSGTEVEMWRERILDVAEAHFRRIGHQKTSMADIASCLGMSTANIYRFFPSRAAINACICDRFVEQAIHLAATVARKDAPAHDKLSRLFNLLYAERKRQLIEEKHVHDLIVLATTENWPVMSAHCSRLVAITANIIDEGKADGTFNVVDTATTARSAITAFLPFYHPVFVEEQVRSGRNAEEVLREQILFILQALGGKDEIRTGKATCTHSSV